MSVYLGPEYASSDYFKGLRTLNSCLTSPASACALVYDGQERQQRSDVTVWRAMDVGEMMQSVEVKSD